MCAVRCCFACAHIAVAAALPMYILLWLRARVWHWTAHEHKAYTHVSCWLRCRVSRRSCEQFWFLLCRAYLWRS